MDWTVEDGRRVASDLAAIFDHLFAAHLKFGHSRRDAVLLASERVRAIHAQRLRIATAPRRGGRYQIDGREFRQLTIDRAIYWFTLDPGARVVRVEAIFHGGQDHMGRMLARLAAEGEPGEDDGGGAGA